MAVARHATLCMEKNLPLFDVDVSHCHEVHFDSTHDASAN